jgi:hypothetical protein
MFFAVSNTDKQQAALCVCFGRDIALYKNPYLFMIYLYIGGEQSHVCLSVSTVRTVATCRKAVPL